MSPSTIPSSTRAQEVERLLDVVTSQLFPFIESADDKLIDELPPPQKLAKTFNLDLPLAEGRGDAGLAETVKKVLKYSVNTWNPGFMDKLYASTDPVGVASDLVLSVLNTNVHVYQVSPALTIIEKETARQFAGLFGFDGPYAGGLTFPGGSASNSTSMIIAKNTLFPETKIHGNGDKQFVVFTSAHGHYSVEKAAILCGFGSAAVWTVGVDKAGRMIASELEELVTKAKEEGYTPFYVNAGAGTTVLGSFDPFSEIATICRKHNLWFHVDGSWGGSVVFSENQKWRMNGAHKADSLTVNPHKMLGVPVTLRPLDRVLLLHIADKLESLFHELGDGEEDDCWDMAQVTMGCGRRGDALKMALGWIYYGRRGYQERIDHAYDMAKYFADILGAKNNFHLVSDNPTPCLQVCFYYIGKNGMLSASSQANTEMTRKIAVQLIKNGFMIDYSPDPIHGEFLRAVVNGRTTRAKIDSLVAIIEEIGN